MTDPDKPPVMEPFPNRWERTGMWSFAIVRTTSG
jgi:hypothetical protein